MLLRSRLWTRRAVAEFIYGIVEHFLGSERDYEPGVVERGAGTTIKTLQLRHLLRERRQARALADRCGQPRLRLWALGADVNVTGDDNQRLVELPGGRVLAFDTIGDSHSRCVHLVPAGSDGPQLALW